jgi:hypothetical protein
MHDQANDLRRLVRQAISTRNDASAGRPKLIVVSGGKGGVGTSTIAVNLAIALVQRGSRTVLVDADTHGADARILCQLDELYTVADVLSARRTVRESLQPGPAGLQVLPGAWGEGDISECSPRAQERLVGQLILGFHIERERWGIHVNFWFSSDTLERNTLSTIEDPGNDFGTIMFEKRF